MLLLEAPGQRARKRHAQDQRQRTQRHENLRLAEDPEQPGPVVTDEVLEIEDHAAVAHGDLHQREDPGDEQRDPRQVPAQGFQFRLQVRFHRVRLNALFRGGEGPPEQQDGKNREQHHGEAKAFSLVTRAQDVLQGVDEGEDQPASPVGADETIGGHLHPFVGRGRDHPHQCRVGNVDRRIGQHHQRVSDVGVGQLAAGGEVRPHEHGVTQQAIGHRHGEEVGPVLAPAGVGAVGDQSHGGVAEGIDHLGDQEHRAHRRRCEAEHIGVVVQQEHVESLEKKVGGGIAHAVAQLFRKFQFFDRRGRP